MASPTLLSSARETLRRLPLTVFPQPMIPLTLGTFLFAFAGTRWLMGSGNSLSTVAEPNHRSLHKKSTPNGGGLAIVIGILLVEVCQQLLGGSFFPNALALMGFIGIAGISFLDDRRPIRSSIRLAVHLGGALCLVLSGLYVFEIPLPGLLDQPAALGWLAIPLAVVGPGGRGTTICRCLFTGLSIAHLFIDYSFMDIEFFSR